MGHFLAGWAGGIPAWDMKVRLFAFPQHVALHHGASWVSPFEFEPYLGTMWRHLVTTPRVYLYTAGGLLGETLFSAAVTIALVHAGWRRLGGMVALMSVWLYGATVLMSDLPLAWLRGHACGDVSGLWAMAKVLTVALVLALLGARVFLRWYAAI